MFEIETNIPIPEDALKNHRKTKYPFPLMKRGDSFILPVDDLKNVKAASNIFGKRAGVTFGFASIDTASWRIWRIK